MSPRFFRQFTAEDLVRFWKDNLAPEDQRIILAYFWSLSPHQEPTNRLVGSFLDFILTVLQLIPVVSNIATFVEVSLELSALISDVGALFVAKEPEERQKALENLINDRNSLENSLKELTIAERGCRLALDAELLAKITLFEEIDQCQTALAAITAPPEAPPTPVFTSTISSDQRILLEEALSFLAAIEGSSILALPAGDPVRTRAGQLVTGIVRLLLAHFADYTIRPIGF